MDKHQENEEDESQESDEENGSEDYDKHKETVLRALAKREKRKQLLEEKQEALNAARLRRMAVFEATNPTPEEEWDHYVKTGDYSILERQRSNAEEIAVYRLVSNPALCVDVLSKHYQAIAQELAATPLGSAGVEVLECIVRRAIAGPILQNVLKEVHELEYMPQFPTVPADLPLFRETFGTSSRLGEGAYGSTRVVALAGVKTFALKNTKDFSDNYDLVHEFFAGMVLNGLRSKVSNFSHTLGLFVTSGEKLGDVGSVTEEAVSLHLVKEYVPSVRGTGEAHLFSILLQLALALKAGEPVGFNHCDLHGDNVQHRPLGRVCYIPYEYNGETLWVRAETIPVMIDFGRARFVHRGTIYGPIRLEAYGIDLHNYRPLADLFKWLTWYMNKLVRGGEYELAERILSFSDKYRDSREGEGEGSQGTFPYRLEEKVDEFVDFLLSIDEEGWVKKEEPTLSILPRSRVDFLSAVGLTKEVETWSHLQRLAALGTEYEVLTGIYEDNSKTLANDMRDRIRRLEIPGAGLPVTVSIVDLEKEWYNLKGLILRLKAYKREVMAYRSLRSGLAYDCSGASIPVFSKRLSDFLVLYQSFSTQSLDEYATEMYRYITEELRESTR